MDKLINSQKNDTGGFSTIELLFAMAIMILVLSAVVTVSFGIQSSLTRSQTNYEAIKIAEGLIEEEQALARKDFNLVNSATPTTENIYDKSVTVNLLPDFLTKEIKALVRWEDERQIGRTLELMTLVTNFDTPFGGNTCDSTLTGDWLNPEIESTIDFSTLAPASNYTITDIDAYQGKLYVTIGRTTNATDPTLFIFDISNTENPTLLGKIDNAAAVTSGFNAIRVSEDPASTPLKTYAFTASNANSNYSTCNPLTNPACGQFNIFDVSDPANPILKANLKVASVPAISGTTYGTSIFYKNNFILLGLAASTGPEFHIIDVHNPGSINTGLYTPIGSFEIGNDINALTMRGAYAYVASPNSKELKILNLTDPANLDPGSPANGFNSSSGAGNGKSMYLVGDRLYLGKTVPNTGNDFHILNNKNPRSVLVEIAGTNMTSSVNSIIVRSSLAFLLTNTKLEIFDIGDPLSVDPLSIGSALSTLSLPASGSSTEPSMDCEGNRLYISSNNGSGQGKVYIIKPN